jgi:hypothetical protein
MKREYDFSKAVKGKFFRPGLKLRLPIYVDIELQEQLQRLATQRGLGVDEIASQLLKKEVELIEEFLSA